MTQLYPLPKKAWHHPILIGLLVCGAYVTAAWIGMTMPSVGTSVTLFWAPTGIAVAAMVRFGSYMAIPVFLAAFVSELFVFSPLCSFFIAVGNTAGTAFASLFLKKWTFASDRLSIRDFLGLVIAASLGSIITATNGAYWSSEVCAKQGSPDYWTAFLVWWQGDAVGILVFGSWLLVLSRKSILIVRKRVWFHLLLATGYLLAGLLVFRLEYAGRGDLRLIMISAMAMTLMLLAMATSFFFAQLMTISLCLIGMWTTARGMGPLHSTDVAVTLTTVWSWMLVCTLITSIIGSVNSTVRRMLLELHLEKRQYEALVHGNPALIARFDANGVISFANDTAETLLHGSDTPIIGKRITEFIPVEEHGRVFELLMTPGEPIPIDLLLHSPNGDRHIIRWKAVSILDEDDAIREFVAVGFDVTDIRRAEAERREFLERLYHAKKLESLSVIAGGIAHDFNNILTGILGHCELGKEYVPEGHPLLTHLNAIHESSFQAAQLVEKMNAYAGHAQVKITPFDVNDMIRSTLDMVRVNLPDSVEVRFNATTKLPSLEADQVQIRRVIMNLIINAGEAIGPKPGNIDVQTDRIILNGEERLDESSSENRPNLPPGEYVRVRVRDDGPGMDESTRKRVFEPFFSTKFQGRGLGLASVMGIIQSHSGTIGVSSKPGRGTLFTFLLPVAYRKPSDNSDYREQPLGVDKPLPALVKGSGLLFLDDESEQVQLSRWLESRGWKVIVANSSEQVMNLLKTIEDPNRFVLLNWNPEDSLFRQFVEMIKGMDHCCRLIFLSHFTLVRNAKLIEESRTGFILHPLAEVDLEQSIRRLFHHPG
jgi:two-component system, cell cycle sensor histidine kinase and response regulator CckA